MFGKPISELSLDDIKQLVGVTKEPEGQFVDYKQTLETSDEAKKELVKDISAFANAQGGHLIIGVEESEGVPVKICGTNKKVGRQQTEEWISGIISANTDPKILYEIKAIPYETDKTVLVIYIKSSMHKPHMATIGRRNSYYRRHLDISSAATHQEVKDMFAESQTSIEALNNFLTARNQFDERSKDFALTNNSKRLRNTNVRQDFPPICLISFTPARVNDLDIDPATGDLREWINTHTKEFSPIQRADLFQTHENEIDLYGITFPKHHYKDGMAVGIGRYIEFTNNGYIEAGFSEGLFTEVNTTEDGIRGRVMSLTSVVAYTQALINFANVYYPQIKYGDQVYLQLSFKNIINFALSGFDRRSREGHTGWAPAYEFFSNETPPTISNYNQFKVRHVFSPSNQNEPVPNDVVYDVANHISRAFGLSVVKCFDDQRTYDPNLLTHLHY